ncbi:MAG: zinc ABC transporter substrate-binding protein, partial [Xanthobacteraceae bacterium]
MLTRRGLLLLAGSVGLLIETPVLGQDRMNVVATFSILGDLVKNVGGDRVEVSTLVGPNGDVHVYLPTPGDARKLAAAKVVFVNGLGLEGWVTRLISASSTKASIVIASEGIKPRNMKDEHDTGDVPDAHAWQSVANAKIYVANIRDGLIALDPAGKASYDANAIAYLGKLDELEKQVAAAIAEIPADRRKIITTHDAFGYFSDAYGMTFIAPEG